MMSYTPDSAHISYTVMGPGTLLTALRDLFWQMAAEWPLLSFFRLRAPAGQCAATGDLRLPQHLYLETPLLSVG